MPTPKECDARFMVLAAHVASWSKDPRTQVGAVVVGANPRNIALGYNGFPPGVIDSPERLNHRPTKYFYTQHAERNVLDNAGFDLHGATIYITMFPCAECAKSIISKGISRVVSPAPPREEPWAESALYATIMLLEAKVRVDTCPAIPMPSSTPSTP